MQHVEKSVNDGLAQVETGLEVIETAGESFTDITEAVGGTIVRGAANQTESIAQQIEEQSVTMQEIHAIVNNLDDKSQHLAELIAQFKVNK